MISPVKKKVAVLLTVIGTKAYTLLRNIVAPDKPAAKEYDQLVEAFRAHLDSKPIIIAERFKFHRRNQREGESIAQYIAELRKLSEHCNFREFLDQALRDRLVCGLTSEATQKRLLAEKDLTLAKAQEIAVGMEAAAKQTNELQVSSKGLELNIVTVDNSKPCFRYAKKGHTPENCYFKRQKCRNCGKQGHTYKVCRAPPTESTNATEKSQPTPPQAGVHPRKHQNYVILLRTYTGETLTICGENQVIVKYKNQQYNLPLVVVEGDGPPLFGRNWLQQITLDWKEIGMVTTNLDSLLQRYHSLFKDELGTMVGVTAKLNVKPNATPKFCRARATPYALRDVIEKDINRLQKLGVLEKVQYSD